MILTIFETAFKALANVTKYRNFARLGSNTTGQTILPLVPLKNALKGYLMATKYQNPIGIVLINDAQLKSPGFNKTLGELIYFEPFESKLIPIDVW